MRLIQLFLCMVLLSTGLVCAGQTRPGDMTVDVPFAFFAAGQEFPAGHYIVAATDGSHLRIFNSHTTGLYVLTHAAWRNRSEDSKLVFHRYQDTYCLSAVWVTGSKTGRELSPSRVERELASRSKNMELAVVRVAK